ncbi:MAG: hypothetical protein ACU0E9_07835 [Limimaricola soesokkakensis]|uniref:hypothetical protein n=1 Tax=Limimaricola soesokkakensis TaxID=1343159 RepID=UPI0040596498
MLRDPHHARAAALVDVLNRRLLAHAAGRRQAHGRGEGARAPAGLAQPRRRLDVLTEPGPGDRRRPITPLGYKTATRALPPVLAGLDAADARRRAADTIADCAERVSGARGGDMQGGDISGLPSDGGATTRVKWAARLRVIEAVANGWPISTDGTIAKGAPRVALPLGRPSPKRQEIKAFPLLLAVCVEGQDMREILVAHGWSPHGKYRRALIVATLDLLERVGAGLGFGRAPRKDDLTRNVSLT